MSGEGVVTGRLNESEGAGQSSIWEEWLGQMEGQRKFLDKRRGGVDGGELVGLDHLYLTTVWHGFALNGLSSSRPDVFLIVIIYGCYSCLRGRNQAF